MKKKYQGRLIHRSLLFTAGHNLRYLNKSFTTNADAIVFDLEDAVPWNKKDEARKILKDFLSKPLPDERPVYVRVNSMDTGYTLLDLDAVASPFLNGFVYPMAFNAKDIIAFDAQLSLKEKHLGLPEKFFDIIVLIETPESILNLKEIAGASERIIGLLFGSEDFLAEQFGNHGENNLGINVPRHLVAMTARSFGIMAIDTPYVNVGDFDGLRKHIKEGKSLGFEGMLAMSPKELPIIHELYTPTEEEQKWASDIVKLHEQAVKENRGIIIYNGIFVSPPTLKLAKKIMEHVNAIKKYEQYFFGNKQQ